ncbi:class I SAM-dependent methyltransferase [Exilibacterium tricleocarpae]|nr:class I SAM-dependent methyltransferase [Exilibacterium tricleocarpae]
MRSIRRLFQYGLLFLVGCTENIPNPDDMNRYEKAVYDSDRWRSDRARDEARKPDQVLAFAQLEPGMRVVDLLGGGGYYTEILSHIVGPSGQVYLQNNSLFLRFSTEELEKRLAKDRLPNVVRLDSEFADLKLPEQVDMIFIGLSYHDIYVPRDDPTIMTSREEFFPQLLGALKEGGKLLIIDHAGKPGSGISTTPKLHRIDEHYAKTDIEQAGFTFLGSLDVLRNPNDNYDVNIWNKAVHKNTDRFIYLFEK